MPKNLVVKPLPRPKSPIRALTEQFDTIEESLAEAGIVEFRYLWRNGLRKLKTKSLDGVTITHTHYVSKGFQEQATSRCEPLSIRRRRVEARRLRKLGLTQLEIADKLGVSQKTISNDLAA